MTEMDSLYYEYILRARLMRMNREFGAARQYLRLAIKMRTR